MSRAGVLSGLPGAGEVRNLARALQMRKGTMGVLITTTTSSFTRDAIDTAMQAQLERFSC